MQRRDFVGVVSGAVVAGPVAVRAQQSERVRFIGMPKNVTRALVFRDPTTAAGIGQFAAIRSVAPVRDTDEIERSVAAFTRSGSGGMIVTSGGTGSRRKLLIGLASRHKLPSIYPYRFTRWTVAL